MKVPMKWLAEFVDPGISASELARRLTMAGLEAEKIEQIGAIWDNVYVGHVKKVERHPNADRLVLADVEAGEHKLTVVTGAPNIYKGQKVALALAGARLYDGHSDDPELKTLKPGMIRGIKSEGMVCSEKELGMSEEHEGIITLPDDAPVGMPLREYMGDEVIEFEITPNLAHAFSIHGIAREVHALTAAPVTLPAVADLAKIPAGPANLVTIEDTKLCPRYIAIVFENVKVGPSPAWLSRRLTAAGMRSINNIVDVTNFVMHELGQPLHAFDRDTLAEGRIVVRTARPGEQLETLDHIERTLTEEMLVIADAEKAVAVAGVMGGAATEVSDSTTTVLLEGANFDMVSVRHTGRALKLRSEAAARYERGVDPNLAARGMARATELILQMCPGAKATLIQDVYPSPTQSFQIRFPYSRIESLLGVAFPADRVEAALDRLEFNPTLEGGDLVVTVPTYRRDVSIRQDIIEEVARVIGYDTLPSTLPTGETGIVRRDPMFKLRMDVRDILQATGASEAVTYVMVSESDLAPFSADGSTGLLHTAPLEDLVRVINPLQADRGIMRPTLIPSLLESVAANLKHARSVRLQELSRVYLPQGRNTLPHEVELAGLVLAGSRADVGLHAESGELDFLDLKGALDLLFQRLSLTPTVEATTVPGLHPGRTARWSIDGTPIAVGGELHPQVAAHFGIDENRVSVAEVDLTAILALTAASGRREVKVPRFLPVQQDFAVVVDEATPALAVQDALFAAGFPLASDIALFDIYRGAQIGDGKKSLAFRVTFTAPDRALTDADLGKVRGKIEKSLKHHVNGTLRT